MSDNWIDIAILLVVAWNIADGIRRGFMGALIGLLGFVLSVSIALSFYPQASAWATETWGLPALLATPAAFAALWVGTGLIVGIVGHFIARPFAALLKGSNLDVPLSVLPSALKGLAVSALVLTVLLSVPPLPAGAPAERAFVEVREAVQVSAFAGELVERTAGFDRFTREIIGEPLSQTLTLLTIRPGTDERLSLSFRIESPGIDQPAERQMLQLINDERKRHGLRPLVRDASLDEVARAHSVDMLRQGYFGHDRLDGATPFDRMRSNGVAYGNAGENLALAPTVPLAHQGLMESPGHRANILRPEFARVGIGAANADGRGRMFTQDFAD